MYPFLKISKNGKYSHLLGTCYSLPLDIFPRILVSKILDYESLVMDNISFDPSNIKYTKFLSKEINFYNRLTSIIENNVDKKQLFPNLRYVNFINEPKLKEIMNKYNLEFDDHFNKSIYKAHVIKGMDHEILIDCLDNKKEYYNLDDNDPTFDDYRPLFGYMAILSSTIDNIPLFQNLNEIDEINKESILNWDYRNNHNIDNIFIKNGINDKWISKIDHIHSHFDKPLIVIGCHLLNGTNNMLKLLRLHNYKIQVYNHNINTFVNIY